MPLPQDNVPAFSRVVKLGGSNSRIPKGVRGRRSRGVREYDVTGA